MLFLWGNMEIYEAIRAKQKQIVEDDKTTITITRTTKTSESGGWKESKAALDPQDVRIYYKKVAITVIDEGGYTQTAVQKMLAYHDADIKRKTADNTDAFTVGSKKYEVVDVINITVGSQIVFKECQIREI